MKTVAIVGGNHKTRDGAPYDREDRPDIWVFNEAASIGWPKRVDAVFQMHKRVVWLNPVNRNDPNFRSWLKRKHPFPIYMQKQFRSVPASVEYPLEEICAALLGGLTKGEAEVRYFTSSVAFGIAMAIYKGYERIELYGVELESDTEYTYQTEGAFFWIGMALGRGIQVRIDERSRMFGEPVYGYEGDVTLKRSHFEERIARLQPLAEGVRVKLSEAQASRRAAVESGSEDPEAIKEYFSGIKSEAQAMIELGMIEGALIQERRYIEKSREMDRMTGGHFFARNEFEIVGMEAERERNKCLAHMHLAGGRAMAAMQQMQKAAKNGNNPAVEERSREYADAHQAYLKAAYIYGLALGRVQENTTLMVMVDELIKAAGGSKAEEAMLASLGVDSGQGVASPSSTTRSSMVSGNGKNLTPALPETGREQEKEAVAE